MYRIVSFMIASILYFSAWSAAILSNVVSGNTAGIICRLIMVVFIALWIEWIAEGFVQRQTKRNKRGL